LFSSLRLDLYGVPSSDWWPSTSSQLGYLPALLQTERYAREHPGLLGSMVLLTFDDPLEPDITFTDTVLGLSHTQDPEHTGASWISWRRCPPRTHS
jgi:hypothetical protein